MSVATSSQWFQNWGPPLINVGGFHETSHPLSYQYRPIPASANPSNIGMDKLLPLYLGLATLTQGQYHSPPELDTTGPLKTIYEWSQIDVAYPTPEARQMAISSGDFIPENNLPLGLDVWGPRIFISLPRWKNGVPITFASLPLPAQEASPALTPYPDWSWHVGINDCSKLISVFRHFVDDCSRLWLLDAGVIETVIKPNPVCPPKLVVFDLKTDEMLFSYTLPADQVKEDSLHSNIIVDVRDGKCDDAHAYLADVWRFGIVVYSVRLQRSWRTTSHLYYPNPIASDYTLHDVNFQWSDGVFGLSLAPLNSENDRVLFYHPMSSFNEFQVSTSVLRNETIWLNGGTIGSAFEVLGHRGDQGHSSASAVDRDGVMFYNLVSRDSVGCWDLRKPYNLNTLGIVAQNSTSLVFPNDLKVDKEEQQGLWVLSNRLPMYLYSTLNPTEVNFRILRADTKDAVRGTVCDPTMQYFGPYIPPPTCA